MPKWEYGVLLGVHVTHSGEKPSLFTYYTRFFRITRAGLEVVADLAKRPKGTDEPTLAAELIARLGEEGWELVHVHENALNQFDNRWYFKRLVT